MCNSSWAFSLCDPASTPHPPTESIPSPLRGGVRGGGKPQASRVRLHPTRLDTRKRVPSHPPRQGEGGRSPVWRRASPSTMAAATATLSERRPGWMGMRRRASATHARLAARRRSRGPAAACRGAEGEAGVGRLAAGGEQDEARAARPPRRFERRKARVPLERRRGRDSRAPARLSARSVMSKPVGPITSTGTPRQAASRRMVPVFWGMSGS